MNQKETIRQAVLQLLRLNPVISTNHVARYYANVGSPTKRASEMLLRLEKEKLIEGKRRSLSQPKVWRLSKRGREQFEITRPPIHLNSNKIDHYLAIASVYQDLRRMGELKKYMVELRESFGKDKYCPDIFFALVQSGVVKCYLVEVQLSPMSSDRWSKKWSKTEAFFSSPEFNKASFQIVPNKVLRPRLLVITNQPEGTVREGCNLPLVVAKSIREANL